MQKPLVNKHYILQKYPGKGGWTYAAVPEIAPAKHNYFGWVKVKGSIDDYPIKQYNLMPMGNGQLFLPVKKEIRKKIKKEAGDTVKIILFPDSDALETPADFLDCLRDEPKAFQFYSALAESEQKQYIQWIYSTKNDNTKIERMAKSVNRLFNQLKFTDVKK